jgi:hypothetical protein
MSVVIGISITWGRFKRTLEMLEDRLKKMELTTEAQVSETDCQSCRVNLLSKMEDVRRSINLFITESRADRGSLHKEVIQNKDTVMNEFKQIAQNIGEFQASIRDLDGHMRDLLKVPRST